MSNLNNPQRKLAEGTSSWLLFEFHAKRGDLFSEKLLSVPVGQLLKEVFPGRIRAEVIHPFLTPISSLGRPPQIDFVIQDDHDAFIAAIESKWIGNTTVTFKQILWDLIRLELLFHNAGCTSFFLVSGFSKKMQVALGNTHFLDPKSTNSNLITRKVRQVISLDLTNLNVDTKNYINDRLSKYKGLTIPQAMYFDVPHCYPREVINMTFQTFVWTVKSKKGTKRVDRL